MYFSLVGGEIVNVGVAIFENERFSSDEVLFRDMASLPPAS